MNHVKKIIAEEVAKIFENEESLSHEDLIRELKFARHFLDILDAEAQHGREIIYRIQGTIESRRDTMDCNELLNTVLKYTYQFKPGGNPT